MGCAVGGTTFELSRHYDEVMGVDFSQAFVDAANFMKVRLKTHLAAHYPLPTPHALSLNLRRLDSFCGYRCPCGCCSNVVSSGAHRVLAAMPPLGDSLRPLPHAARRVPFDLERSETHVKAPVWVKAEGTGRSSSRATPTHLSLSLPSLLRTTPCLTLPHQSRVLPPPPRRYERLAQSKDVRGRR